MKHLLLTILALAVGHGVLPGQEHRTPPPDDLLALRTSWQAAKEKKARPIKDKHLKELIELRARFTKQQRLAEAMRVQDAIRALTSPPAAGEQGDEEADKPKGTIPEIKALQNSLERELEEMNAKLDIIYRDALRKNQRDAAKNGDLEFATAYLQELRELENRAADEAPEEGESLPKTKDDLAAFLVGTKWVTKGEDPYMFTKDGFFANSKNRRRFSVSDKRTIVVNWRSADVRCVFSRDYTSFQEEGGARNEFHRANEAAK